jgi:hypothetical protein
MSKFYDMIAEDLGRIHEDEYGPAQPATHIAGDGKATPCRVTIDRGARAEVGFRDGISEVSSAVIIVLKSQIRSVAIADKFLLPMPGNENEKETWNAEEVLNETPAYREVRIARSRRTELTDEAQQHDRARGMAGRGK